MQTNKKYERLKSLISNTGSVAVAYSGGVDSTLLLKVAHDVLGDSVIALTAISPSFPAHERERAKEIANQIGVRQVYIESRELEDERYAANSPQRCYFCKKAIIAKLIAFAREQGYDYVIEGTNADDIGNHRPGWQAIQECEIRSPLQEVGLTKSEIRSLAKQLDLPNWNSPAAACLASRISYGTTITPQILAQVEKGETILRQMGFKRLRVRHHGAIARIEIPPHEFSKLLTNNIAIVSKFKEIGYTYITLDLAGLRSGSMNEVINNGH